LEYEIYTFGEENVIVPVSKKAKKIGIEKLAEEKIKDTFRRFDPNAEVEILSENSIKVKVDKQNISSIIGRGGSTIKDLEKILQVHIDVIEKDSYELTNSNSGLPFDFSESRTFMTLTVEKQHAGFHANIYVNDNYLTSSRIGRNGQIKIPKRSSISKRLMKVANSKNDIQIFLKD